jgi:hypothetical protein
MNSKILIRKALSMCLAVALVATYSMVTLASSEKIAGEILVNGTAMNGQNPFVKVNGEPAQSGRSIFTASTIATPENASAIVNLGKIGKIQLAPNTVMSVSFNEKGISGDLTAGRVTVLNASNSVSVKSLDGKVSSLNAGQSVGAKDDDDDDDNNGGGRHGNSLALFALILGGAIAGLLIAVFRSKNRIQLGGGNVVVSTIR